MILLDNITLKNVIIIICLIKDHDNFISTYLWRNIVCRINIITTGDEKVMSRKIMVLEKKLSD